MAEQAPVIDLPSPSAFSGKDLADRLFVAAAVLSVLGLLSLAGSLVFARFVVKRSQPKLDLLVSRIESLKETEDEVSKLSTAQKAFLQAAEQSLITSSLLSDFEKTLAPGNRLGSFSLDETGRLSLEGKASNYTALATFVVQLEDREHFSDVVLVSAASDQLSEKSVNFSLTAEVDLAAYEAQFQRELAAGAGQSDETGQILSAPKNQSFGPSPGFEDQESKPARSLPAASEQPTR